MTTGEQIIIFGGTFDPPHLGHARCLKIAAKFIPEARIIVMPANVPPAGEAAIKSPLFTFQERLQMCRLAFQSSREPFVNVEVSDIEGSIPAPNYTLTTLQKFMAGHQHADVSLLLGEDQFLRLPFWHKPKDLLALVSLLVIGRHPESETNDVKLSVQDVLASLSLTVNFTANPRSGIVNETGKRVTMLESSQSSVSSSAIRETLKGSGNIPKGSIAPEVHDYLTSKNLIKEGQTTLIR